jgi:hypothetical protein
MKEVDASPIDRFRRHSVAEIRTDLFRQLTVAERYTCFDLFAESHSVYTSLRHNMPVCLYTEKAALSNFNEAVLHHNDGIKGERQSHSGEEVEKKGVHPGWMSLPLL